MFQREKLEYRYIRNGDKKNMLAKAAEKTGATKYTPGVKFVRYNSRRRGSREEHVALGEQTWIDISPQVIAKDVCTCAQCTNPGLLLHAVADAINSVWRATMQ